MEEKILKLANYFNDEEGPKILKDIEQYIKS